MALERTSRAEWRGDLKGGDGEFTVGAGVFSGSYSFASRFEQGDGTNPEELLGAAHAACYSMAFANMLAEEGHTPDSISTDATVTLVPGEGITEIALRTVGRVPGVDDDTFRSIADKAKAGCPVSQLFAGAQISVEATLES